MHTMKNKPRRNPGLWILAGLLLLQAGLWGCRPAGHHNDPEGADKKETNTRENGETAITSHRWGSITGFGMEKPGYGLYTYVLFGRRLDQPNALPPRILKRYLALLDAIVVSTPAESAADTSGLASVNIFYIPGREDPVQPASIARSYDSDLALEYLGTIGDLLDRDPIVRERLATRPGPFLVSFLEPPGAYGNRETYLFYADLTSANPAAMGEIVSVYKSYVAEQVPNQVERFNPLRLRLLNFVLNADDNLRLVRVAMADWIPSGG